MTRPALGLGTVTVALSVITSAITSSSLTVSPSFTCHLTSSPSITPSPRSGSLNSKRAMGVRVPSIVGGKQALALHEALHEELGGAIAGAHQGAAGDVEEAVGLGELLVGLELRRSDEALHAQVVL